MFKRLFMNFWKKQTPDEKPRIIPDVIEYGLLAFPNCKECQCYPECRTDCPNHLQCLERLPGYRR